MKAALAATDRLAFRQSARWWRVMDGNYGHANVYDETVCAYCGRPVRSDADRLRTARTNDGAWWLVSADVDLNAVEWRDFQTWPGGSRIPTILPIGPDCLRQHPEFRVGLVGDPA